MGLFQNLSLALRHPLHCVDSGSREVASGRRNSLPTRPISLLTRVQSEDHSTKSAPFQGSTNLRNGITWPEAVCQRPDRADWRHFGTHKGSSGSHHDEDRAPGSTVAQQALPPRFDRFRDSGTECGGNRCETCTMFPEMRHP